MDLGVRGRRAIVCGASTGLGRGVALALAEDGVEVVMAARGEARLRQAADEIRSATGASVTAVVADSTTDEGREALLAACPRARHPDQQCRRSASR